MAAKSRSWILILVVATLMLPATTRAQERPTVIRATTVLDGKGGTMRNASIVVQGTRIARIDANGQSPTGAMYDLKGLTVMPGWIDTHLHIDAHFDRDGKNHNQISAKNESPQQTMHDLVRERPA